VGRNSRGKSHPVWATGSTSGGAASATYRYLSFQHGSSAIVDRVTQKGPMPDNEFQLLDQK
jgi:hypothetical protein